MHNIINTDFAKIDPVSYPIIRITANGIRPTDDQIELFIGKLIRVIKANKGKYVLLANGEKAVWMNKKSRELLATGLNFIEVEFAERHCCNYIYVPSIMLWVMVKMANLFIKPEVLQKVYFNMGDAEKDAKVFTKDF